MEPVVTMDSFRAAITREHSIVPIDATFGTLLPLVRSAVEEADEQGLFGKTTSAYNVHYLTDDLKLAEYLNDNHEGPLKSIFGVLHATAQKYIPGCTPSTCRVLCYTYGDGRPEQGMHFHEDNYTAAGGRGLFRFNFPNAGASSQLRVKLPRHAGLRSEIDIPPMHVLLGSQRFWGVQPLLQGLHMQHAVKTPDQGPRGMMVSCLFNFDSPSGTDPLEAIREGKPGLQPALLLNGNLPAVLPVPPSPEAHTNGARAVPGSTAYSRLGNAAQQAKPGYKKKIAAQLADARAVFHADPEVSEKLSANTRKGWERRRKEPDFQEKYKSYQDKRVAANDKRMREKYGDLPYKFKTQKCVECNEEKEASEFMKDSPAVTPKKGHWKVVKRCKDCWNERQRRRRLAKAAAGDPAA